MSQHNASSIIRTYAFWFVVISIVFFTVYPLCNWLTAQRATTYHLYIDAELGIPFIPQFVWLYLSLYLLFLIPPFFLRPDQMNRLGKQLVAATVFCGIVFLLIPAELGFDRVLPEDPFYESLFSSIFKVDLPHNLVPSLHISFSALILITLLTSVTHLLSKSVFGLWLVLISLSTLFVHQHHLLDVITGLLVAALMFRYVGKGTQNE